jgi:predicted transcriptional regulator
MGGNTFNFVLSDDLRRALDNLASTRREPRSVIVRRLIRHEAEENQCWPPTEKKVRSKAVDNNG